MHPGAHIPRLLHLGAIQPAALRDLRERVLQIRRGDPPLFRAPTSVALLTAEPCPFVRAGVEAGASLLGLRVTTYTPDEVARLGEPGAAGERLGALHAAILGVRLPAATMVALAERSVAPVIEAGGPGGDPAGALADLLVVERALGGLDGRKLAWIGDATGLFHDLLVGGASLGLSVAIAHPVGFAPDMERVTWARERAALSRAAVLVTTELAEALHDASAVYVEPWPAGAEDRFRSYALQRHTLRPTRGGCVFLHSAPERRGGECSPSLLDEPGWLAMEQSRARADAWAAVLGWCLQPDPIRSVLRRER